MAGTKASGDYGTAEMLYKEPVTDLNLILTDYPSKNFNSEAQIGFRECDAVHYSNPPPVSSLVTHTILPRVAREGEIAWISNQKGLTHLPRAKLRTLNQT